MIEVDRPEFRVTFDDAGGTLRIRSGRLDQTLVAAIAADSADGLDLDVERDAMKHSHSDGLDLVRWTARSTVWTKHYEAIVHGDRLTLGVRLEGASSIDTIRYFSTTPAQGFVEDFAVTKHFNDRGTTRAREYAQCSPVGFTQVMTPDPNSHARQVIEAHERAQVSVNADLDNAGGNFVANPGMLAFAVTAAPDHEWWCLGLLTRPGAHLFSELVYDGGSQFTLEIGAWGAIETDTGFTPPAIVLAPARTSSGAFEAHRDALQAEGLVPSIGTRESVDWWTRPIVSGWGHQAYQGDLFRIRSAPERGPDNAVYTLCTQTNYQDIAARLEHLGVPFGTLVIDARWFLTGGLKDVDEGRWPDLAGFVAGQHRMDRHVLLWWSPWDPEGIDQADCITWHPRAALSANRPGRQSKFGPPTPGKKMGVDITLPRVRERIRGQLQIALGADGLDADGLKLDHVSATPGLYGMQFPEGSDRLFGIEAAYEMQRFIYETAKEIKPDALIMGQSPNPYFGDVQDMVRLGDVYSRRQDSVLAEMTFRAEMASIAIPNALIDTDGWPMPSRGAWREYVAAQPSLGIPSLYYVTHLDTTGEALTPDDFAHLRRAWRGL
ncbi:hypothetical protein GCM10027059_37730 [Myceligenerans halotolerans]